MNKYEKKYNWIINYEFDNEDEIKEIKELVERATPKKPVKNYKVGKYDYYSCPICGDSEIESVELFCPICGQALDWSE